MLVGRDSSEQAKLSELCVRDWPVNMLGNQTSLHLILDLRQYKRHRLLMRSRLSANRGSLCRLLFLLGSSFEARRIVA